MYYIIYDTYYNEYDRVTPTEYKYLKQKYINRYVFIGVDN